MLAYIYNGEVNKLNDLAAELVVAADKYDIDHLKLICEEKLLTQVSAENCIIGRTFFKTTRTRSSSIHQRKQRQNELIFV